MKKNSRRLSVVFVSFGNDALVLWPRCIYSDGSDSLFQEFP